SVRGDNSVIKCRRIGVAMEEINRDGAETDAWSKDGRKDMDVGYLDFERVVDELFPKKLPRRTLTRNRVTGSEFCWGIDPIAVQKKNAVLALRAREWFDQIGPRDAPRLPISYAELDAMRFKKRDPLSHLVAQFASSLRGRNWDYENHPSF